MTLRGFHIVFIVFSTLLALLVCAYCIYVNLVVGEPIFLLGAIAAFLTAIGLLVYGFWFLRKMKRMRLIT